jgi:hypothetical protein
MLKFLILGIVIFLLGCAPKNPTPMDLASTPVPKVDLTNKSQDFKDGYRDGCQTAQGNYTKDSSRFKSNPEYNEGWFAGRSSCHQ